MSATDTRPAVDERRRFERAWETKRLADVAVVDPESLGSNTPRDFSFRYISLEDVSLGKIHGWTDVRFCEAPSRARRRVRSGDILFGTVRPNLKSHVRLPDGFGEAVCSTGFATLRCDPNSAEPGFVFPLFFIEPIERQIEKIIAGSNYPAISSSDVKALTASFPSLPEQRAIAAALSDVDDLLQSLDRLIAKKRDVKQGAMQQLLTGTTRLPGFEGAWETKQIGSFTICKAGGTPSTEIASYWGGPVRWMSSGELNLRRVTEVKGRITEEGLAKSSAVLLPENCVLIGLAGQGKTRGTAALNLVPLSTNQSIAAILPSREFSPEYLYFNLYSRYEELRELSSGGGGRGGLNLSLIKSLAVPFPTLSEQSAIAAVLRDMDAEIDALEARRDKVAAIKQGMMQELLTGRTRLPIPEEAIDA